ncbi:GTPase [Streptomyces sp. NBC_01565]|uniref:GTPase n=1 Tax=unclassified Streptomyces TaxID=2593676 RepID=UPI00225B04C2|nr:GTPase [Streptomyces sp. NBC_01565]MCX4546347.1 50S ribosome-binding GTPase [Streptomyces sp. NBC_01565]
MAGDGGLGFARATGLQDACAQAVEESQAAAEALGSRIRELASRVRAVGVRQPGRAAMPAEHGEVLAEQVLREMEEAVGNRMAHLGTFNITLFGRTGAGKSSLLEALTGGDGSGVSPGSSDWTTEVHHVVAGKLRVTDTPGVEGWGRSEDPEKLRARALAALAASDLVVLCFDTQNQRAAEFRTVAEWVVAYRKPAIAVLNVRNSAWRYPPRARTVRVRRGLSRTVREHADELGRGLRSIGLPGTTVIALSAKNAAFARVTGAYAGHDEEGFLRRVAQAGTADVLLEWSNLQALETLLVEAVGQHATQLRLTALYEQVRTCAARAAENYTALRDEFETLAAQTELGIERVLAVLGAPEVLGRTGEDAGRLAVEKVVVELSYLESLRGRRFPAPSRGSALHYADQLVTARIGPLRAASLARAEQLVDRAMAERRKVTPETFADQVFGGDRIANAVSGIRNDFTVFLKAHLELVAADVRADVKCVMEGGAHISGAKGRLLHRTGVALAVAGALAVAVLTIWNPLGWGFLAVGVGGVLGGLTLELLGSWSRKRAAARHEQELGRARADARRTVNEAFDQLLADLGRVFTTAAQSCLAEALPEAMAQATTLRESSAACDERLSALEEFLAGLPPQDAQDDPRTVLYRAAAECELYVGRAADLWLGEAWTEGWIAQGQPGTVPHPRNAPAAPRIDVAPRVADALAASATAPGAGRAWLDRHRAALSTDPRTSAVIAELDEVARDGRVRIAFCGDQSAGKSALIARLLRASGHSIPASLASGGGQVTRHVAEYPWHGLLLVDTPGFQSREDASPQDTRLALAGATVIVHVFNATALAGDLTEARAVLGPGRAAPLLLVIGRADEIGIDPEDSPRAFARLCAHKEAELHEALRRTVDRHRRWPTPVCLSPAPYGGTVTDASWDGVTPFADALLEHRKELESVAADIAVLDRAVHRLTALAEETETVTDQLQGQREQLVRLRSDVTTGRAAARALDAERVSALERVVADLVEELVRRALATPDKNAREAVVGRLERIACDPELAQLADEWARATHAVVEGLVHDTSASLARRRSAVAYATATAGPVPDAGVDVAALRGGRRRSRAVGPALSRMSGVLSHLDKVARAAKEGMRGARFLKAAGPVVGAAGTAWSMWELVEELRGREQQESERAQSLRNLHAWGRERARDLCDREPSLQTLRQHISELDGLAEDCARRVSTVEAALAEAETRISLSRTALETARRHTGRHRHSGGAQA